MVGPCVMSTKVTIQLLAPFQSRKNQTLFLFKPFANFPHGYFEHMDLVDETPKSGISFHTAMSCNSIPTWVGQVVTMESFCRFMVSFVWVVGESSLFCFHVCPTTAYDAYTSIIPNCKHWVFPKNRGRPPNRMVYNGKPLFCNGMIWGENHYFWKHPDMGCRNNFPRISYLDPPQIPTKWCVPAVHWHKMVRIFTSWKNLLKQQIHKAPTRFDRHFSV